MTNEYNAFEKEEAANFKKPEKRSTTLSLVAGLIVLLVIISVIAYRSGVDIKQVRSDVASFAASLKARYAAEGIVVDLTYGAVDADGGLFNKTIKITEPKLSVAKGDVAYTLSAPDIILSPEDSAFKDFKAELSVPLTITYKGGEQVVRVKTPAPVHMEVTTNEAGMREYMLPMQAKTTIEVDAAGVISTYDVTLSETSLIAGAFSPETAQEYALSFNFDDGTVTHQGKKSAFSQATYDFTSSAETGEQTDVNIEALTSDYVPSALAPLSVDIAEKRKKDEVTGDEAFEIEKFLITGNGFDFDMGGSMTIKPDALLPLVDMNVTASGAANVIKALGDAQYVAPEIGRIIISALGKIAPEWNPESTAPLAFSVTRSDAEPFMIGQVKADELLAIALKEWYVSTGGTVAVPAPVDGSETPAEPALDGMMTPADAEENVPSAQEPETESQNTESPNTKSTMPPAEDAFLDKKSMQDEAQEALDVAEKAVEVGAEKAVEAGAVTASEAADALKDVAGEVKEGVESVSEDVEGALDTVKQKTEEVVGAPAASE
jgi:gas vesicle protein